MHLLDNSSPGSSRLLVLLARLLRGLKKTLRQILSFFRRKESATTITAMPTYQFRLRFNMLKGDHINSEQEELELLRTQDGQIIRLRAGSRGTPIKASSEIAIIGGPYSSPEEATEAARRAHESVVVWALRQRLGVDFGDGILRSFITDFGKKHYERELGHPARNDRLGIDVYESQEGLLFASRDAALALGKNVDTFVEQMRQTLSNPLGLSEKQMLAAELYSASFFDVSFRSRFITLVTAIEALLDPSLRSNEIQVFVNDAKAKANALVADPATKQAMVSSLDWLRNDSIGQTGRVLAERLLVDLEYDGLRAGKFFSRCYRLRSEIVHNGKASDPTIDLLQLSNTCQAFVADLLLTSIGLPHP